VDELTFTLCGDGTSDEMLLPILEWILHQLLPNCEIKREFANPRDIPIQTPGLVEKIQAAIHYYPCQLLFIHRDAEREEPDKRHEEIQTAANQAGINIPYVGVVPQRMSEAWLLFDEPAIRRASENPNGKMDLQLPGITKLESLADPKDILLETLRKASELKGRKLKDFKPRMRIHNLAALIEDFSPLRALEAFQRLEHDIEEVCRQQGWAT
jgi:hypothetical protein